MNAHFLRSSCVCTYLHSDATSVEKEAAPDVCVICMEPMSDDKHLVELKCGHKFHGQCVCDHLVHDGRCPICRYSPYNARNREIAYSDDGSSFSSDEEDEPRGPSLPEAFELAKLASKTDKNLAKMLKTHSRWKSKEKTARKELKAANNRLRPLRDALDDKIDAFKQKQMRMFDEKYSNLINDESAARVVLRKCVCSTRQTKKRIAQKQGYNSRMWRPRYFRY